MDQNKSPRKGDQEYIESFLFDCPRLGGPAMISIRRFLCAHENPADNHNFAAIFAECRDRFKCGICVGDPNGAYTSVEPMSVGCAAHKMMDEHGDIVTGRI